MSVLPGLGPVLAVRLDEGAFAVGRTLAELDLRACTDANVLAIHRDGGDVLIPTGTERLRAFDVLALAGADEARARGEDYLLRGPGADPDEAPDEEAEPSGEEAEPSGEEAEPSGAKVEPSEDRA